jgi:hypothetical protein
VLDHLVIIGCIVACDAKYLHVTCHRWALF